VGGGTLAIDGNQSGATGAVSVASGAALGGTGSIGGAVTISGSLRPGNSIGVLTVANDVTWNWTAGNAWVFELGAAAATLALADSTPSYNDRLDITGAGNDFLKGTGPGWTFDFAGTGALGWYKLVDWSSATTFAAGDFAAGNLAAGLTGAFTIDGDTSALVVPGEPVRYLYPGCPTPGDVTARIQVTPDAVIPVVLFDRIVDHEDDQLGPAVSVQVSDSDPTILVFP
jgi:hypothetical protein